ncbi:MAG: glycosyltransferase [Marinifilaceae bacterium]
MRITYISTYPPIECGIATYTQYLSDAVKDAGKEVRILSQQGAQGADCFEVYSPYDKDIAFKLFQLVEKQTPDLVHIQHEFGLFGDQRGIQIVEFLIRCRAINTPVVVTFHTVYENLNRIERMVTQHILNECSAVIVHEDFQREILIKDYQVTTPIEVIPHGVRNVQPIDGAKSILGLEEKKVVLLAGYFRATKNFERIIKLFPKIVEREPDAVLLFAARNRINEYAEYQQEIYQLISQSPVKDHIMVLDGKFPQYTFDAILSAADVMTLPYVKGAQSGVLAQASALHLPVVTSDLDSFKLWIEDVGGGFYSGSDDEFVSNILNILQDQKLRKKLQRNIQKKNLKLNWDVIAEKHLKLYGSLITSHYKEAKFFYLDERKSLVQKPKTSSFILNQ